jgi:hypothetical protein
VSAPQGLLAFVVQENDDRPTVTIHRDALLGLIHKSAPASPHTVQRDRLCPRGQRDSLVPQREAPELMPSLSPILVAAVIILLTIAFLAAAHAR